VIGAPEISTDGYGPYKGAIRDAFGNGNAAHQARSDRARPAEARLRDRFPLVSFQMVLACFDPWWPV
jgi:hypothetical protein